jgi:hypothetical protein
MPRTIVAGCIVLLAVLASSQGDSNLSVSSNLVLRWNSAALRGARDLNLAEPIVPRALAIVHTCMYDAWSAYDEHAVGTQMAGALRFPVRERTWANKEKAVSYAAYRALVDLFPADADSVFKPLMKQLGYDPNNNSVDIETPVGIGNVACGAVLEFRHRDKSNQLGDLAQGSYSDWTHFRPVNMPALFPPKLPSIHPIDLNRWQPLIFVNATGDYVTQMFAGAQWSHVIPFAFSSGDDLRGVAKDFPPAVYGSPEYRAQAEELIRYSAGLTDQQKMIAEYWSEGPDEETSTAHWNRFAEWVSQRDHHSVDDDVKMFFVLNNALLDASIAALDLKRQFDTIRPITAITSVFNGTKIRAWGGPGEGTVEMDGSQWIPYQPASFPTPPTPEYISEYSAEAAAAAEILIAWTGDDRFGYSITFAAHSSKIEPETTPAQEVILSWPTFTQAADSAGESGQWGGTQFRAADLAGRKVGRLVGQKSWEGAKSYFEGLSKPIAKTRAETSNVSSFVHFIFRD